MKVSVVVPVYNGSGYIVRCIQSILCQLDQDMELIVVDDASTDGTFALLAGEYQKDDRVILVRSTVNGWPAVARNTGIRLARGMYIGFCDADDEWKESKLEKQLACFASHPETQIVFTADQTTLDEKTERTEQLAAMAVKDNIHFRTALIKRGVFEESGLLDESLRIREDTEWLVRVKTAGCKSAFLEEPLYVRHILDSGLSAGAVMSGRKERVIDAFMRGIRRKRLEEACRYDVSILIPVFNAEKYVREAIESCVSDKYSCELVIVNDGSADDSFNVVSRFMEECESDRDSADVAAGEKEKLPVTFVTRRHKGQASSRNDAYRCARGRYILYLDADDCFLSGAIDLMMDTALQNPEAMLVSALCRDFISPDLTEEEASKLKINPAPYRRMLAGCMLLKREIFDAVGLYDEGMPTSETAQWVLRVRDAGLKIHETDNVVLARRYHKENLGRLNRQAQMNSYMAMIRNRLKNKGGR